MESAPDGRAQTGVGEMLSLGGHSPTSSVHTNEMVDSLVQSAANKDSHPSQANQGTTPTNEIPVTPSHITLDGSTKVAHLEYYILLAEQVYFKNRTPKPRKIFRPNPNGQTPTLRSDRENRILVYPGSFNPPHLGQTGLLWHTYLSLDDKTIAAMILPMSTASVSRKKLTGNEMGLDDRMFKLSSIQRGQLWRDNILSRFTWVWPEDHCGGYTTFMM